MRITRPNTKSVRFRTTAGAVVALTLLLAVAGLAINLFVGRQVLQSFDETLLEQATDRAALLSEGAPVESLMTAVGYEAVVLAVDPSGDVVASSGETPQGILGLPAGVNVVDVLHFEPGEEPERETFRVAVAEATDGTSIIVANEGEAARRTQAAVRNILLAVVPLIALAGAAVAWFVTGRALEPVRRMSRELDDVVHAGDGRRVSTPDSGDEIDELGATINDVLDRLDGQSLARRQFVANASHELKSPLANARAIIDTAAATPDHREHERVTSAVGAELNRLHALVDDLLYLARDDEGAPRSSITFDLADLVFDESERVAATSNKRIDASGVVPADVVGDPTEITRAIRNLIENAERFAETRVQVSVVSNGDGVLLRVVDDGPGVPVEHRESVFERFSRLDNDRARAAGGTGLGLSIVASIADRNHGSVSVADAPTGGAQFELVLPRP